MTLGITSGVFDMLHPLQVQYLKKCRASCDRLLVLIDSDMMVQDLKNKEPIMYEADRAYMVASLGCVSEVRIINDLPDLVSHVNTEADIYGRRVIVFKNARTVYGLPILEFKETVLVQIIPDVRRFNSTTEIVNHLKQLHATTDSTARDRRAE